MGQSSMSCLNESGANNRVSIENDGTIYHEKQSKELCALHALNNLFQNDKAYTKKDLDSICYKLSPLTYINPHKSMFGLGNYDINVIMAALQQKSYDTIWFDKRKDLRKLCLESIEGFILNIPTDYKLGYVKFPLKRRHWVTIRKVGEQYYNLDSKLDAPEAIGGSKELVHYLQEQVKNSEKELLLVVTSEVAQEESWYDRSEDPEEKGEESERQTRTMSDVAENTNAITVQGNGEIATQGKGEEYLVVKTNTEDLDSASQSEKAQSNGTAQRVQSASSKYETTNSDCKSSDAQHTNHS